MKKSTQNGDGDTKLGLLSRNTIKATYTNPLVQHYRKIIDAAVNGETPPLLPPDPSDSSSSESSNSEATIRQTVLADPTIPWTTLYPPLLRFLRYQLAITYTVSKPARFVMATVTVAMGATLAALPERRVKSISVLVGTTGLGMIGFALLVFVGSKSLMKNRLVAFKSAQNLLLERILCGRAVRTNRYDLYIPPPLPPSDDTGDTNDKNTKKQQKTMGLLFYPGALVSHTAYAPTMAKLSLETSKEEATKNALKIMYEVIASSDHDVVVTEWAVGGHSLEGLVAIPLATAMTPGVSKVVHFFVLLIVALLLDLELQ